MCGAGSENVSGINNVSVSLCLQENIIQWHAMYVYVVEKGGEKEEGRRGSMRE